MRPLLCPQSWNDLFNQSHELDMTNSCNRRYWRFSIFGSAASPISQASAIASARNHGFLRHQRRRPGRGAFRILGSISQGSGVALPRNHRPLRLYGSGHGVGQSQDGGDLA